MTDRIFGEGITAWGRYDYSVDLEVEQSGLIYDRKTFKPLRKFRYTGEGWGITHDDHNLILSDGTSTLRFLDPKTFKRRSQTFGPQIVEGEFAI